MNKKAVNGRLHSPPLLLFWSVFSRWAHETDAAPSPPVQFFMTAVRQCRPAVTSLALVESQGVGFHRANGSPSQVTWIKHPATCCCFSLTAVTSSKHRPTRKVMSHVFLFCLPFLIKELQQHFRFSHRQLPHSLTIFGCHLASNCLWNSTHDNFKLLVSVPFCYYCCLIIVCLLTVNVFSAASSVTAQFLFPLVAGCSTATNISVRKRIWTRLFTTCCRQFTGCWYKTISYILQVKL